MVANLVFSLNGTKKEILGDTVHDTLCSLHDMIRSAYAPHLDNKEINIYFVEDKTFLFTPETKILTAQRYSHYYQPLCINLPGPHKPLDAGMRPKKKTLRTYQQTDTLQKTAKMSLKIEREDIQSAFANAKYIGKH